MAFPYKQVLMVGATAGIGAAMADRLVQEGVKVIAVGRRQDRLDAFVQKHGADMASAIQFDISDRAGISAFVAKVTQSFPALDCLFLNAGVQAHVDLAHPDQVDMQSFCFQMDVNFTSFVDLTLKFLPFLLGKSEPTSIIFTSSNLAIIPCTGLSAYSASKAALNAFILCLRDELRQASVKIIELSPPVVQTELHDYMGEEKGRAMGMPVQAFTEAAYRGLASGDDQVIIGAVGAPELFNDIVAKRRKAFEGLSQLVRGRR